jgi:hypothetical protein
VKKVKMIQRTPHNWRIESASGHIMQDNITAHSQYEAEEYVKRYISSFQGWSYEIVTIGGKNDFKND